MNYLTRRQTARGARWALDGNFLPESVQLGLILEQPGAAVRSFLQSLATNEGAEGALLPPLEPTHEVWAAGVTYKRSREARRAESAAGDVYDRVYAAERPELFFKSTGWRVVAHDQPIRIRRDSKWNVPEPELTLVINRHGEIVGYCAGDDVSSRDIEGENPLYLPQAKIYNGGCALGPGIQLATVAELQDLPIRLVISNQDTPVFSGETRTAQMNRRFEDLVRYLCRELTFPQGVLLMTGTGIVPPDDFTLNVGHRVRLTIGELCLENEVHE